MAAGGRPVAFITCTAMDITMGRFGRSWQMFKTSMGVIRQDKELLWMPVLSFLATLIALGGIVGVGFLAGIFPEVTTPEGDVDPVAAALGFLTYLLLAFVQVYFHAATVAGANERLAGGDPTVGSALRKANQHLGRLFLWSLVVATVNIILQAIRQRSGTLGRIVVSLVGTAWNLATYFVVPTLLFEDAHIGSGLKRSGGYFKRTWGETLVGEIGVGFVGGIITLLIVLAGVMMTLLFASVAGLPGALVGIGLTVLAVIMVSIVFTVAAAVYKTALYRYVSQGSAGGPFSDQELAHAYRAV